MRIVMLLLGFLLLSGYKSAAAETNFVLKAYIKEILLREDYPHKQKDINACVERLGIDKRQAIVELERIVDETLHVQEAESENYVLSKMAIDVLGRYGDSNALATVRKAAKTSDRSRRIAAISAYIRIAQEGSLDFAKEVVTDTNHFGSMERRVLYERLAECSGEQHPSPPAAKRREVRRFLVDRTQVETDADASKKLDQLLCGLSPSYKVSLQREAFATRFEDETATAFRDYFRNVLLELRSLPMSDRIDLTESDVP